MRMHSKPGSEGALWLIAALRVFLAFAVSLTAPYTAHAQSTSFTVTGVHFTGNTVFDDDVLQSLVADLLGPKTTLAALEEAAERIGRFYRERGYPLSYAFLPPQEIVDGTVQLRVVEGRYDDVVLRNTSALRDRSARAMLGDVQAGALIELTALDRAVRRLSETPGVRATATLQTGDAPDTARLLVNLVDTERLRRSLSVDTFGSPSTGTLRATLMVDLLNPTGSGDQLSVQTLNAGEGMRHGQLAYQFRIGRSPFTYTATLGDTRYRLIDDMAALNAHGSVQMLSLAAQTPYVRSTAGNLDVRFVAEQRRLSDVVLSVEALRTVQTYGVTATGERQIAGGRGAFSLSMTWGNLRIHDETTAAQDAASANTAGGFFRANATLTRQQPLTERLGLHAELRLQWASKNLHGSEKLSLGGASGVRGYGSGEASGDDGWLVRLELQQRLGAGLQAIGFVDGGGVRIDKTPWDPDAERDRTLFGGGLGLLYTPMERISLRVDAAWPFAGHGQGTATGPRLWARAVWSF